MKMKKRLSLIAAILICGLMCTTCDLFKEVVKKPEVTLKSVDFSSIDFTGLTLLSKVDIKNNNSVNIPLPKIDWDLNIIGSPFINGTIPGEGSLKAQESTEVEFPVSFTYLDLINAIIALSDENVRSNAMYKINMMVHIPVPQLGDVSWPFEHDGKIPLMQFPEITVATEPSASFTYGLIPGVPTGGKIDFALNVKNNSNVAVTVNALSCVLKIGNTLLSPGGVTNKPNINANATEKLNFSFPLTITDLAYVSDAVLTGNFNYTLTGDYKFGIPDFPLLNEIGDSFTLH
jgi:LEA14-like dessication related protein